MDNSKASTLKYRSNLAPESVAKMKESRAKFIEIAKYIESLGNSRELSLAFTAIEHAQMLTIKHFCLVDTAATVEEV